MNSHSMRAGNSTVPTSVWCAEVAGVCIIPSAQFTPATQLDSWVAPSRRCELSLTNRRPPTKALSLCPMQLIGLVDYSSLKKSICRVRLFSSRFLKQFMD